MPETIIERVKNEVKVAMKARDKERLAALRLMMAEFKRVEVDERIELEDTRVLAILDKMTKQRKDSEIQFRDAGRLDLEAKETLELAIIAEFMPEQLSAERFIRKKRIGCGAKQCRARLTLALARFTLGNGVYSIIASKRVRARIIGGTDAGIEHGRPRATAHQFGQLGHERLETRVVGSDGQAGVGAKLPNPQR